MEFDWWLYRRGRLLARHLWCRGVQPFAVPPCGPVGYRRRCYGRLGLQRILLFSGRLFCLDCCHCDLGTISSLHLYYFRCRSEEWEDVEGNLLHPRIAVLLLRLGKWGNKVVVNNLGSCVCKQSSGEKEAHRSDV